MQDQSGNPGQHTKIFYIKEQDYYLAKAEGALSGKNTLAVAQIEAEGQWNHDFITQLNTFKTDTSQSE